MKILFTNNARKMAGLPVRRKKDSKKRCHTRNSADEAIESLMEYLERLTQIPGKFLYE